MQQQQYVAIWDKVVVSILTRAFARVQRPPSIAMNLELKFQSSLELSPECNGLILACVQDGAQEAVCANPPKKASDAGWGKVEGKRVFNVP
ncbi:putative uncharacterized protein [Meiothermus ruber H328]|nr:putative uncharacterized protein [Meiothermus ruber H328]